MHDKLTSDISTLNERKARIKAKVQAAKAQEHRQRIESEMTHLALEFMAQGGSQEEFVALASAQAQSVFSQGREGDQK